MSRVTDLAQKLEKLEAEASAVRAEMVAELKGEGKPKVAPKRKATTPVAPAATDGTPAPAPVATEPEQPKRTSLKQVVQTILAKNPDGLDLQGIVNEVHGMIQRKEYASNAQSLSAVVSQAVNALKQENLILHDRESKKYSVLSKS